MQPAVQLRLFREPQPYRPILEAMRNGVHTQVQACADASTNTLPAAADEFWLLSHTPTFTQGTAGRSEHILDPARIEAAGIDIVQSDRGGQVTYHAPGQLVLYALCNIQRLQINIRQVVVHLEQVVVEWLADNGVHSHTLKGRPGVYVDAFSAGCGYNGADALAIIDGSAEMLTSSTPKTPSDTSTDTSSNTSIEFSTKWEAKLATETTTEGAEKHPTNHKVSAKVASLGLRVRHHQTYHGLSVNLNMDLEPFSWVNPCGYSRMPVANVGALGVALQQQPESEHACVQRVGLEIVERLLRRLYNPGQATVILDGLSAMERKAFFSA